MSAGPVFVKFNAVPDGVMMTGEEFEALLKFLDRSLPNQAEKQFPQFRALRAVHVALKRLDEERRL